MKKNLKPGRIVQLRSGGPLMTVEGRSKQAVTCSWFVAGDGYDLKRNTFPVRSLKLAKKQ